MQTDKTPSGLETTLQGLDPDIFTRATRDAEAARKLADLIGAFAVNLVIALLILVATLWLSRTFSRLTKRAMTVGKRRRRVDITLANFIASIVRYLVLVVGLIAVLGQLGVQTTSILAVLGAASLAVGLALQGTLSNVAAGVMLLLLRPYRVADFVEISGRMGTVRSLDLFTTELISPEGMKVVVPNGKVFGDLIVNFNALGTRRVDVVVGVDYDDDLGTAKQTLLAMAASDPRVLQEPPPWVGVQALADSSINLEIRAWVKAPDFVDAQSDLTQKAKEAIVAAGLHIPYPHQVDLSRAAFMGREGDVRPLRPSSDPTADERPR